MLTTSQYLIIHKSNININERYVSNSQIIESSINGNNKFEYPIESISDNNISGLKSMINYIKNNNGKSSNSNISSM